MGLITGLLLFSFLFQFCSSFLPSQVILHSKHQPLKTFLRMQGGPMRKYVEAKITIRDTDMLLLTPTSLLSVESITQLKKLFNAEKMEILNAGDLADILDGTPFVQLCAESLKGNYFTVFIDSNSQKAYDVFIKWMHGLQKIHSEKQQMVFYACKRGHMVKLLLWPEKQHARREEEEDKLI